MIPLNRALAVVLALLAVLWALHIVPGLMVNPFGRTVLAVLGAGASVAALLTLAWMAWEDGA